MAKRPKHQSSTYQKIYDAIGAVKTLNFKPKFVRQYAPDPVTGKKVYVRTVKEFSPQQKATLSRMAFRAEKVGDEIRYGKSHLYNLATGVARGEFEFVKLTGKDKKQKAKFFKDKGFVVTDKGTFNTRQDAKESKIVKSPEGYRLEYKWKPSGKPPGRGSTVYGRSERREMFVPFPSEIIGNPEAIALYIDGVAKMHKANEVRVAVNGHQGLQAYDRESIFKYVSNDLDEWLMSEWQYRGEAEIFKPVINGFYLVFKERFIEYKKPMTWKDPKEDKKVKVTRKGRKK